MARTQAAAKRSGEVERFFPPRLPPVRALAALMRHPGLRARLAGCGGAIALPLGGDNYKMSHTQEVDCDFQTLKRSEITHGEPSQQLSEASQRRVAGTCRQGSGLGAADRSGHDDQYDRR